MDGAVITLYFARNTPSVPGNDQGPVGIHEDGDIDNIYPFAGASWAAASIRGRYMLHGHTYVCSLSWYGSENDAVY